MSILTKIKTKLRYGTAGFYLLNLFNRLGIEIKPFYWVREKVSDNLFKTINPQDFNHYQFTELLSDDLPRLVEQLNNPYSSLDKLTSKLERSGEKCFVLSSGDEIAAYCWLNTTKCTDKLFPTSLKQDEGYLHGMYTLVNYRGKKVAPYLRVCMMKWCQNNGVNCFYSISEFFNKPSIRFKEKLNAEFLSLHLYIELFSKYSFRFCLKKIRL